MRLAGLLQRGRMRRIVHHGFNRMQTDIEAELAGDEAEVSAAHPVQRGGIPSGQA